MEPQKVAMHKVMSNSLHLATPSDIPNPNGIDAVQLEVENALEGLKQIRALGIDESLINPIKAEVERMKDQRKASKSSDAHMDRRTQT